MGRTVSDALRQARVDVEATFPPRHDQDAHACPALVAPAVRRGESRGWSRESANPVGRSRCRRFSPDVEGTMKGIAPFERRSDAARGDASTLNWWRRPSEKGTTPESGGEDRYLGRLGMALTEAFPGGLTPTDKPAPLHRFSPPRRLCRRVDSSRSTVWQ